MSECEKVTLGDFISLQRGITYKSALLGQPGAVLIGLASIEREGGFRKNKLETYGGDSPEKILLKPGDLYVSLKDITQDGHLLGAVARLPDEIQCGRLTQDTVKLVFEREIFPRNYIYWLLRTPQYRKYCRSRQTGTTNLGLSREDFLSFSVPPLTDTTNAIVLTLESIEKKIENLRRQNETLEAIAQTLFKHWFVDFEFPNADGKPYKSSGGAMEPSELGEIPAGWRVCAMENVIEVRDGTHDSPKQTEEGFHLITSKHLKKSGIDFDSAYLISEYDYIEVNKRSRVDTYDILLSMIGTVGILYFVMDKEINFVIKNIGLFKSSQNLDYAEYIFLFLDSIYGIAILNENRENSLFGASI